MSCITGFTENNPCAYRAILGVVGAVAAIAVAINTITLLANLKCITFSAFSLSTPASLGIGIPSALILATVCALAIHSCCKKSSVQGHGPVFYSEEDTTQSEGGRKPKPITMIGRDDDITAADLDYSKYPNSILGAPASQSNTRDPSTIIRGKRTSKI